MQRAGSLQATRHARRRNELGLMCVGAIVIFFADVLSSYGVSGTFPRHVVFLVVALPLVICFTTLVNRKLAPDADPILMPISLFLNGMGLVLISEIPPDQAGQQAVWTVVGLVVYTAVLLFVRRSRDLERYRYLLLFASFVLLVLPLLPGLDHSPDNTSGTKLWVALGPLDFQPVEVAKLLLVVFFASYFVEKKEMLTLSTKRIGNHLLPDARAFGPVVLAAALSVVIILVERDVGFALLLFVIFLSLLWVATGRALYVVVGLLIFALGTILAQHLLGQVNARIAVWLDPWKYYNSAPPYAGQQPVQGELAFARGGLFGSGLGLGLSLNSQVLPIPSSDFIFAVIGEELGLVGTTGVVICYVLLLGAALRTALRAASDFAKLCALGLTAVLGFQVFFIMAGIVRLLPLTGVTLPFVSYGGSSLVANYALVALLMRISNEANQRGSESPVVAPRTTSATMIGTGSA